MHVTPHCGKLCRIELPVSSANKGQDKNLKDVGGASDVSVSCNASSYWDSDSSRQTAQKIKEKNKTIFHNIYETIVNLTTVWIFDIEELFFKI